MTPNEKIIAAAKVDCDNGQDNASDYHIGDDRNLYSDQWDIHYRRIHNLPSMLPNLGGLYIS